MRVTPSSTSSKIIAIIVQNPLVIPGSDMPLNQNIFEDWLADQPPESHQLITDIRSRHHRLWTQLHRRHQMGLTLLLAPRNLPTNHHLDPTPQRLRPTRILQWRNNARPSKHPRRHRQKTPTHQSPQSNKPLSRSEGGAQAKRERGMSPPVQHHPPNPNQLRPSLNQPSHHRPRLPLRLKQSVPEQLQSCNNCGILFLHRVVNATPAIDKDRTQYRIKA